MKIRQRPLVLDTSRIATTTTELHDGRDDNLMEVVPETHFCTPSTPAGLLHRAAPPHHPERSTVVAPPHYYGLRHLNSPSSSFKATQLFHRWRSFVFFIQTLPCTHMQTSNNPLQPSPPWKNLAMTLEEWNWTIYQMQRFFSLSLWEVRSPFELGFALSHFVVRRHLPLAISFNFHLQFRTVITTNGINVWFRPRNSRSWPNGSVPPQNSRSRNWKVKEGYGS